MASTDSVDTNTEFARQNDANFPILSDPNKSTANAYGVIGAHKFASRWTFYIDANGIIAFIDKNVKPLSAAVDMIVILERIRTQSGRAPDVHKSRESEH